MEIKRTKQDIDRIMNECRNISETTGTKFTSMSYEDGIIEALEWILDPEMEDLIS